MRLRRIRGAPGAPHSRAERLVLDGIDAWDRRNLVDAERLLTEAVELSRKTLRRSSRESVEDLHFALDRLGALLVMLDRPEAAAIIDEALARNTERFETWRHALVISARRRNPRELVDRAEQWSATRTGPASPWEAALGCARTAIEDGDARFARAVSREVVARTSTARAHAAKWEAMGVLGHGFEIDGHVDRAIALWSAAFAGGSTDALTAERLAMHHERRGEYEVAADVCRQALARGIRGEDGDGLRARIERCEAVPGATTTPSTEAESASPSTPALQDPYPPFHMTYVRYDRADAGVATTVELAWRNSTSWDTVVVGSSRADEIGRTETYDGVSLQRFTPAMDVHETVPGVAVPEPWFDEQDFAEPDGWEDLGPDANGWDQFRSDAQPDVVYKRDPQTGVIMEILERDGPEFALLMQVVSLRPVESPAARPPQDPAQ